MNIKLSKLIVVMLTSAVMSIANSAPVAGQQLTYYAPYKVTLESAGGIAFAATSSSRNAVHNTVASGFSQSNAAASQGCTGTVASGCSSVTMKVQQFDQVTNSVISTKTVATTDYMTTSQDGLTKYVSATDFNNYRGAMTSEMNKAIAGTMTWVVNSMTEANNSIVAFNAASATGALYATEASAKANNALALKASADIALFKGNVLPQANDRLAEIASIRVGKIDTSAGAYACASNTEAVTYVGSNSTYICGVSRTVDGSSVIDYGKSGRMVMRQMLGTAGADATRYDYFQGFTTGTTSASTSWGFDWE